MGKPVLLRVPLLELVLQVYRLVRVFVLICLMVPFVVLIFQIKIQNILSRSSHQTTPLLDGGMAGFTEAFLDGFFMPFSAWYIW